LGRHHGVPHVRVHRFRGGCPGQALPLVLKFTIALLLTFGLLTIPVVGGISTRQPTPWAGVIERINIFMDLQWVAVSSISQSVVVTYEPQSGAFTNDFFVNLIDMRTE
jgi:hypothetical protein